MASKGEFSKHFRLDCATAQPKYHVETWPKGKKLSRDKLFSRGCFTLSLHWKLPVLHGRQKMGLGQFILCNDVDNAERCSAGRMK